MEQNKTKSKKPGYLNTYLLTALFSVGWLMLSQIVQLTHQADYGWDNLFLNLPNKLAVVFSSCDRNNPDVCLYGRYINRKASDKVTITAIDDYTFNNLGYPFKRKYYATIIEKLNALGVKAIGMDILFFEADKENPENDRIFASAVAKAGNVVNQTSIHLETRKVRPTIKILEKPSAVMSHPHVDVTQDRDGQVRRYSPFYPGELNADGLTYSYVTYEAAGLRDARCWKECRDLPVVSLGLAPYAVASGKTLTELFMRYNEEVYLNYRTIVRRKAHPGWKEPSGSHVDSSFRHISVLDLINNTLSQEEKEALKDGITFVGSTALGAYDHVPSPFHERFPGVEVHATFLDNLLAGDFRQPMGLGTLALLMLALPWVPVLLRKSSLKTMVLSSLGVIFLLLVSYFYMLVNNTVMPFVSVFLAIFLPFAYITVDKGLAESREKKWIKNSFGQYLSPKVVDIITNDPAKLSLGGEKREMTAFFLDIAGFTTMSEKLPPEELTAMLTNYLSGLTDIVLKHDGTVDKFIGDCIMAFWNAPLDQQDHRRLAVLAAVDCQAEMKRLNDTLTQYEIKPSCRVGLNTGPMVVGNMGSKTRMSYTIMGDAVNLASRFEGANKFFHSKIMTSEETFGGLKDQFDHRYLGSIRVVGKAIPVKVYEPFARKGEAPADVQAMLVHYNAGQEKFYKGDYAGSLDHFKAALMARPGDGPSEFYVDMAKLYAKEPPKDWDQSFNLTSKG